MRSDYISSREPSLPPMTAFNLVIPHYNCIMLDGSKKLEILCITAFHTDRYTCDKACQKLIAQIDMANHLSSLEKRSVNELR